MSLVLEQSWAGKAVTILREVKIFCREKAVKQLRHGYDFGQILESKLATINVLD